MPVDDTVDDTFRAVELMTPGNLLRATFDGKDWSGHLALTDVWVRRDGRWQILRRHPSNLVPGAS